MPDATAGGDAAGHDDGGTATDAAADGPYNILLEGDASFTLADFQAMCDARGGFFYVNAACAGGAACKGLSFHAGKLWEHSCRAQNSTCAGANCVDTPADTGLTGQQVYEQGPCGGCHGLYDSTTNKSDYSWYAVFYYTQDPNQVGPQFDAGAAPDYASALALYKGYSYRALEAKTAFGVSGVHADGTAYNNMAMYYQKYSKAEMKRVAQYLQANGGGGLKPFGYGYPEYPYLNLPDAGAPADAGGD